MKFLLNILKRLEVHVKYIHMNYSHFREEVQATCLFGHMQSKLLLFVEKL